MKKEIKDAIKALINKLKQNYSPEELSYLTQSLLNLTNALKSLR